MTYEPLHHKYRPQSFAELVGQEAIATTLSNALRQQKIAPAYLFTGARGTGKTSSARILAKSLNCLQSQTSTAQPCGHCEMCRSIANGSALDVIEIDAASNTGVDNIRELIERSQFAPVQARYKVYVIDECLTGDALVLTRDGLTRIDDPSLQGQEVISYNDTTGTWEYKKVLRWLDQGIRQTYEIQTDDRTIKCTGNHLIRTVQGWIPASDLNPGMQILSPASVDVESSFLKLGQMVAAISGWEQTLPENGWPICDRIPFPQWSTNLERVESVRLAGVEQVYDIEVEDNHNFVANGLLVHNCHMLSTAAFNALLKTLEEPPDRVVFVLATTDPQRVLPTIISRCQRFDFRRIELAPMVTHLQTIAAQESIEIAPEAIQLVAQISQGGLRDAESLLDQLSLLEGQITSERVWDLVGAVPERDLLALVQAIGQDDPTTVLDTTRRLMDRGREPLIVLQNLASFYRDLLIAKTAPDRPDLVAITAPTWANMVEFAQQLEIGTILASQQRLRESEVQVKNTTQPRLWLEVTLMGLLPSSIVQTTAQLTTENRRPMTAGVQGRSPQGSPPPPPGRVAPVQPVQTLQGTDSAKSTPQRLPVAVPESAIPEIAVPERVPEITAPEVTVNKTTDLDADRAIDIATAQPPDIAAQGVPEVAAQPDPGSDLEQIWQDMIAQLKFRGTQTLLCQQGCLLAFNGREARISIRSQPLLNMVKSKIADIEAAFAQLYQGKIRVTLELATATTEAAIGPNGSAHGSTTANGSTNGSTNGTPSPHLRTEPPIDSGGLNETAYPAPSPQSAPLPRSLVRESGPASPSNPSEPVATPPPAVYQPAREQAASIATQTNPSLVEPLSPLEPAAPNFKPADDDEIERSAKSFAQFFNGEIVSLDATQTGYDLEDLSALGQKELSTSPTDLELDETDSDPDSDVPF